MCVPGGGSEGGGEGGGGGGEFVDALQIWTFDAAHPRFHDYVPWIRATMINDTEALEGLSPPVTWRLVDINHTVSPYVPPQLPASAREMVQEQAAQMALFLAAACAALLLATSLLPGRRAAPPAQPPLSATRSRAAPDRSQPQARWGDEPMGSTDQS